MNRFMDLHTHTTASDGSMSPRELVRHAKECGLSAIAVTDHDTVEGINEAVDEGEKIGIEVIPGLEISVDYKPEMHILGYFFCGAPLKIHSALSQLRKNREERNPKIINKLNEMGFDISMEEVQRAAMGSIVGRPHIAKVLAEKGYVKNPEEAFHNLLSSGKPAYFKKERLTPREGIGIVLEADGLPVLAHPMFLNLSLHQLDSLLEELVREGLKGIEAYYVEHSDRDTGNLLRLALKHNLLVTGGSDFHGTFKPDIKLGKGKGNLFVPYELLEKLRNA